MGRRWIEVDVLKVARVATGCTRQVGVLPFHDAVWMMLYDRRFLNFRLQLARVHHVHRVQGGCKLVFCGGNLYFCELVCTATIHTTAVFPPTAAFPTCNSPQPCCIYVDYHYGCCTKHPALHPPPQVAGTIIMHHTPPSPQHHPHLPPQHYTRATHVHLPLTLTASSYAASTSCTKQNVPSTGSMIPHQPAKTPPSSVSHWCF